MAFRPLKVSMAPGRPRISVVNDNPEFLELMTEILDADSGYEVTTFSELTTGVDDLAASEPDLIIVDLLLGGASGWEIVALARADQRLAEVPVLLCSADVTALREREDEFAEVGNIHVLAKPFGISELNDAVERLLERSPTRPG